MKRVGLCVPKPKLASTAFITPQPEEVEAVEEPADADRYPRPRYLKYESNQEEVVFSGMALSEAQVNHAMMAALSMTQIPLHLLRTLTFTSRCRQQLHVVLLRDQSRREAGVPRG